MLRTQAYYMPNGLHKKLFRFILAGWWIQQKREKKRKLSVEYYVVNMYRYRYTYVYKGCYCIHTVKDVFMATNFMFCIKPLMEWILKFIACIYAGKRKIQTDDSLVLILCTPF